MHRSHICTALRVLSNTRNSTWDSQATKLYGSSGTLVPSRLRVNARKNDRPYLLVLCTYERQRSRNEYAHETIFSRVSKVGIHDPTVALIEENIVFWQCWYIRIISPPCHEATMQNPSVSLAILAILAIFLDFFRKHPDRIYSMISMAAGAASAFVYP